MKNYYASSKLIVLLFATMNLVLSSAIYAGGGYDYSRSELMGNSGLTIFREADFGNEMGPFPIRQNQVYSPNRRFCARSELLVHRALAS